MQHDLQLYLPEAMYHLDENMNLEKISRSYIDDTTVTCKVTRLDCYDQVLEVDLGNHLYGIIPFEDASIYPAFKDDRISPSIISLVGHDIRAQVTSLKPQIVLSRKRHMLQALSIFAHQNHFEYSTITGFSSLSAFVDIGAGITGKLSKRNFIPVRFRNIRDIGFKLYDTFPTDVLNFDPLNNWFELSRLSCLPHFTDVLQKGDVVTCKVFDSVPDGSGYHVCINKSIAGIVDSTVPLYYGSEIVAVVRKEPVIGKKSVQLSFLSFL